MISAAGFKTYLMGVYRATAIYVWGADCEIGTEELLKKKIEQFGAEHYRELSKSRVEGMICADCSGLFTPISGRNMTAQNYYDQCKYTGPAGELPKDKMCLLFRKQSGRIVHVAGYTGDGYLVEMWDGCERRKFKASEWTYYGFPTWLEEQSDNLKVGGTVYVRAESTVYNSAANAKAGINPCKFTYPAGTYYVYKIDKNTGSVNITKTKGKAGGWAML